MNVVARRPPTWNGRGPRGFEPAVPKCRIVVPPAIDKALRKAGLRALDSLSPTQGYRPNLGIHAKVWSVGGLSRNAGRGGLTGFRPLTARRAYQPPVSSPRIAAWKSCSTSRRAPEGLELLGRFRVVKTHYALAISPSSLMTKNALDVGLTRAHGCEDASGVTGLISATFSGSLSRRLVIGYRLRTRSSDRRPLPLPSRLPSHWGKSNRICE